MNWKLFLILPAVTAIGCIQVDSGGTTGGVDVCTGSTMECGDGHDESDNSQTESTVNTANY
jgi:hypothetical protein